MKPLFKRLGKKIRSDSKRMHKIIHHFRNGFENILQPSKTKILLLILTIFMTSHSFSNNYKLKQETSNFIHKIENNQDYSTENKQKDLEKIFVMASDEIEKNVEDQNYVSASSKIKTLQKIEKKIGVSKKLDNDLNKLQEEINLLENKLENLKNGVYNYKGKILLVTESRFVVNNSWEASAQSNLSKYLMNELDINQLHNLSWKSMKELQEPIEEKKEVYAGFTKKEVKTYKIFIIVEGISSNEIQQNQVLNKIPSLKTN